MLLISADRLAILTLVVGASLAAYLGAAFLLRIEEIASAALLLPRQYKARRVNTES